MLKIFPGTTEQDWIHDKQIPNSGRKYRPDYRNDDLMLIVEYDGLQHYTSPDVILGDTVKSQFYESLGYKVVRIPYFIQLTSDSVEKLFGVKIEETLFNPKYTSLSPKCKNTPAFLCDAGVKRMAKELSGFKEQLDINLNHLEELNDDFLTGVSLLKKYLVEQ